MKYIHNNGEKKLIVFTVFVFMGDFMNAQRRSEQFFEKKSMKYHSPCLPHRPAPSKIL